MIDKQEDRTNLREYIGRLLEDLQIEQERRPLRLALQMGYLSYVRLFIESQRRSSLQEHFPYAGFPMEWSREDEEMDTQQRIWQLSYQMQYCSSVVEEGHFMEEAQLIENGKWADRLCRLIDWASDHADWEEGMPRVFGRILEEMICQIYSFGNSGIFLTPDVLTRMIMEMVEKQDKNIMWNPSCRAGEFLTAAYEKFPQWELRGAESEKELRILSQMLQFYYGAGVGNIAVEDALEHTEDMEYDVIVSNLPVGEVDASEQNRFFVPTRKIQLQYLQQIMEHLKDDGQAFIIVTEGTLFKFDAEMKVRERLVEKFRMEGVISLPADAFLPYTGSKASILVFSGKARKKQEKIWFYELEDPGYTLDKYRQQTESSQIPHLLDAWKKRSSMEELWNGQLQEGIRKNQWDNPVPERWQESHFWFADVDTVRKNDYNLTVGRYKPWKEKQEQTAESPLELLNQLTQMEKETMEQIQELLEMTKEYE